MAAVVVGAREAVVVTVVLVALVVGLMVVAVVGIVEAVLLVGGDGPPHSLSLTLALSVSLSPSLPPSHLSHLFSLLRTVRAPTSQAGPTTADGAVPTHTQLTHPLLLGATTALCARCVCWRGGGTQLCGMRACRRAVASTHACAWTAPRCAPPPTAARAPRPHPAPVRARWG